MKTQKTTRNFLLISLLLIGLFGLASISLAGGDTWTKKANMPTARRWLASGVVNGKIYAIGGSTAMAAAGGVNVSTVEKYDPATDTWTKKTDMPMVRALFSTSVVNGKIYAIGGRAVSENAISTVEVYDPKLDDFSNVFFLNLAPGLNMVSLPLMPRTPYTARSFAEELYSTVVIKLDEARQRFVGFTLDAPDDGFAIEGGKGYIVNVPDAKVVALTGAVWTNQPPLEAAPILTQNDGAWAFVVSGRFEEDSQTSEVFVSYSNIIQLKMFLDFMGIWIPASSNLLVDPNNPFQFRRHFLCLV